MGKKRVLSLILMLMIVVCCVTEAVVIGQLKAENAAMRADIQALTEADEVQGTSIDAINGELAMMEEEESPDLYLPRDIYVCSGLTMELYNDCVAVGYDPDEYDFYWECEIGDCMNEKWRVRADDSKVGDYMLTLHVYNMQMEEVASVISTVHVIPNAFDREDIGNLKVVTIGDDLSAGTDWYGYTRSLSQDKLSYLGTLGADDNLKHEGRVGITAGDYLAGTHYGQPTESPFINPATGEFDWAYYTDTNDIEPDVVQIFLGTNGLEMDSTANADSIFGIVDKIREADATIPIVLIEPIYPADQNGMARQQNINGYEELHGMWAVSRERMVFNLLKEIDARAASYDNLTLVPTGVMFDRDYGFEQELLQENPHSEVMEAMPAEGVYPSDGGYDQIGDSIYSALCYLVGMELVQTTHEEETGE